METLSRVEEINEGNKRMDSKKFLVSFVALVSILFLAASVSSQEIADNVRIRVNELDVSSDANFVNPAIIVGDTILVRVEFDSLVNAQDVIVKAEIETNKESAREQTAPFDVEEGNRYAKTLRIVVPFDLRDKLSDFADLSVTISGSGLKDEFGPYQLRVQRESYKIEFLSISTPQTIKAGDFFPVEIVLRNIGYNDLRDLFVTARISALNIERSSYLGDLVALRCDKDSEPEDNWGVNINRKCIESRENTISGKILLQVPYDVKPGVYTLEVNVEGEDIASSKVVQVMISNRFPTGYFFISGNQLLIVNPTNEIVVYKLVPQSTSDLSVSLSENLISIPAGSSKTILVKADSKVPGTQKYSVSIFTQDGKLVDTLEFTETFEGTMATSPIAVLTIVLAIIFIVLLIVLIVLIGKKPSKEGLGESYY